MTVDKVEDLVVYQKALAAADEVSVLLKRPEFGRDFDLRDQLGNSSSRVPALIAEGFEQKSDRHFAHYLYLAKGSAKESTTHLRVALARGYVSAGESARLGGDYEEIKRSWKGSSSIWSATIATTGGMTSRTERVEHESERVDDGFPTPDDSFLTRDDP